jgi:hypothetical protein
MPKTKISEFSATPANNTDIDSINIAEGCAPSGINDAIRELMAQLKDFQTGAVGDSFNGPIGTTTAAAGAFTTLSSTGNTTLGDASGDAITVNGTATFANANPTLTAGTANGVTYLNGSKVLTSGSALTYSATSGLTTNGVTQGYNTTLYTVDGTLSNYSAANNVYLNGNTAGGLNLRGDGTGGASTQLFLGGATSSEASKIIFTVANSEGMRLTSTGLGIGTTSPDAKLNVYGGSLRINNSTTGSGNGLIVGMNGNDSFISNQANGYILFGTNNTERMRLDSSGNLGLGVTPSAWASNFRATQIGQGAYIAGRTDAVALYMGSNGFWNGSSDRYIANGFATDYYQATGSHIWRTAASGTAGNAITFTQAMTLDASGNLLVGGTTSLSASAGRTDLTVNGSSTAIVSLGTGGTRQGYFYTPGTGIIVVAENGPLALTTTSGQNIQFNTNNTERARIDSSGNLMVGTTSITSTKLAVAFNGNTENGSIFRTTTDASGAVFAYFQQDTNVCGYIARVGTTSAVVYNTTSDYRLKTVTGAVTGQGSRIDALKPVDYQWKEGNTSARGFLAHEFQAVYPNSVTGTKDAVDANGNPKYQGMQAGTAEVIADLVAEIQSLRVRVAQLETN